jgi:signal transduction histidine kinase
MEFNVFKKSTELTVLFLNNKKLKTNQMKKTSFFAIIAVAILAFLSCNNKQEDPVKVVENFIEVVNMATEDSIIDKNEAENISKLVDEINKMDKKNEAIQKTLDKKENKELSENMTDAMMSLFFCKGYEAIEGLE